MVTKSCEVFRACKSNASFASSLRAYRVKTKRTALHATDVCLIVDRAIVPIQSEPAVAVGIMTAREEGIVEPSEAAARSTIDDVIATQRQWTGIWQMSKTRIVAV